MTEADLDASLDVARDFLARLSAGEYRVVYGSLLTTGGQQRLADLVLGRLALSNPHISFFELLGSQPADGRIAVDVIWRETFEGQGELGTQEATVLPGPPGRPDPGGRRGHWAATRRRQRRCRRPCREPRR